MRTLPFRAALLALLVNGSAVAAPPLAAEQLSIESLPSKSAHWVYVVDYAFLNERLAKQYGIDGVKGDHMRRVSLPPGCINVTSSVGGFAPVSREQQPRIGPSTRSSHLPGSLPAAQDTISR